MINYNDNYDVPNTDNEYYDAYDGDYTESTTILMDASTEMPKKSEFLEEDLERMTLEKKKSEGKEKLVKT